jgi:hypothetical protein
LALRRELANSLGGEAHLPPQQRKRIDLAARASLLLDHVDAWLFQQPRLVNARAKTLLPALAQRQALADHLVRLLDSSRRCLSTLPVWARQSLFFPITAEARRWGSIPRIGQRNPSSGRRSPQSSFGPVAALTPSPTTNPRRSRQRRASNVTAAHPTRRRGIGNALGPRCPA